jgi:2,4-dienoyl-CoA reductase-like NADH-dependent reductase (Old Yellow Enzyme family)
MNKLFEPYQLHELELANRILMAPLTRARAGEERIPNDIMVEYYTQRASAGLIITEATTISEQANGWLNSPGIYTDEMAKGWRKITDSVHSSNGKIFIQLWHCGRASHSSFHNGKPAVAPSAIKINGDYIHTPKGKESYEIPKSITSVEIHQTIKDYQHAARRAKEVGFDGIEVHSANGYLLDTFLQSKTNHRTDEYGGSIESRYRMLDEVIHAICEIWPSTQVGVRISPNGVFNDMGSGDYREQFLYVAGELNKCNLAYLHIMDGLGFGFHEQGKPMRLSEFREIFSNAIIGNVGYTKESAENVISEGNADLIAFGRPFISNPDLVNRFKNNIQLNPEADITTWYTPAGAEGYIDFPVAD